jgi:hypothetical protein
MASKLVSADIKAASRFISLSGLRCYVLLWSCLWSVTSLAVECDMAFRHGILISPEQIRILTDGRTQYQINNDNQLFVQGLWLELPEQDTTLLKQYSQGMRRFVPQVVGIAVDSVEVGLSTIENMLVGVGNPAQQQEWKALVRETTYQLMSRFVRSGEHFYLAPQSLNEMDSFLHGELKENLNLLAKNTVGAVWQALRNALRQTDDNFEQHEMQDWQAVEALMEKINSNLDAKAEEMESKSVLFCQRLRELDHIETQLQQRVPQLLSYDVVIEK